MSRTEEPNDVFEEIKRRAEIPKNATKTAARTFDRSLIEICFK
jgi:hypothetical protein